MDQISILCWTSFAEVSSVETFPYLGLQDGPEIQGNPQEVHAKMASHLDLIFQPIPHRFFRIFGLNIKSKNRFSLETSLKNRLLAEINFGGPKRPKSLQLGLPKPSQNHSNSTLKPSQERPILSLFSPSISGELFHGFSTSTCLHVGPKSHGTFAGFGLVT